MGNDSRASSSGSESPGSRAALNRRRGKPHRSARNDNLQRKRTEAERNEAMLEAEQVANMMEAEHASFVNSTGPDATTNGYSHTVEDYSSEDTCSEDSPSSPRDYQQPRQQTYAQLAAKHLGKPQVKPTIPGQPYPFQLLSRKGEKEAGIKPLFGKYKSLTPDSNSQQTGNFRSPKTG